VAKIDAILNLVWALICIGALGAHFWRDRLGLAPLGSRTIRWKQTLSVLVAAVALFPVISASDDRIRLAEFDSGPAQQTGFERGQIHNFSLSAPLEDPENGQTAKPLLAVAIVCFCFVAPKEASALARWFSFGAQGRAPPAFA
jgi:hypothetical protein